MSDFARAHQESLPPDDGVRVGIVASVSPLVVTLQGAPVPLAGQLGVSVSVGDPVALLRQDQSWLVMGAVMNAAAPADRNIVSLVLSNITQTINSATLTPITGMSVAFNRQRPSSRMRFAVSTAGRQGGGASQNGLYTVLVTHDETGETWQPTMQPGVKYDVASVTEHASIERTLVPAATLGTGPMTCQIQGRTLLGGAGVINISPPDSWALTVEEI